MSSTRFRSRLREHRDARDWSQAELARRSGLSRASVSAIETGRVVPSTAAALALAETLGVRVERLFVLTSDGTSVPWAWDPPTDDERWWWSRFDDGLRRFPVEPPAADVWPHDGRGYPPARSSSGPYRGDPERTIVVAGCDPAAGLLARRLADAGDVRLIHFPRSSRRALDLLERGCVHAAGIHLGGPDDPDNDRIVAESLGQGYRLLRVATWAEGLAVAPGSSVDSVRRVLTADLRWVGREPGSGARACLDRVTKDAGVSPPEATGTVGRHREVSAAIRAGWADAGVCVQVAAAEAGLAFFTLGLEAYDLVLPPGSGDDPRIRSLVEVVRSSAYRELLSEVPGYDTDATGTLR
ncbi:MAG: substrate-binding domain-containing protein [Gemmatimonadota bacterium]